MVNFAFYLTNFKESYNNYNVNKNNNKSNSDDDDDDDDDDDNNSVSFELLATSFCCLL